MVKFDASYFFKTNFSGEMCSISKLSDSGKGKILVTNSKKLYDFDKITDKLYNNKNNPTSADALFVSNNKVIFIEFKSGFQKNIKNLDPKKLLCPYDNKKCCEEHGQLLLKKLKLDSRELLDSIKFKAIESYTTLEKKIFPKCKTNEVASKVIYCVVVDDYVDSEEDILGELAKKKPDNNVITNIKSALSRFLNQYDADCKSFYYDEIKVFNPYEFNLYIDKEIALTQSE